MLKRKPQKLNWFYKIVLCLNCFFAFALLLAYLAPFINPSHLWQLAFFSMAYIPVLCVNAVFVVFWLVRLKAYALISGVGILLGAGLIGRNIGFRKPAFDSVKSSPNLIRVMSYNVYDFLNINDDIHESTVQQISAIIQKEQPDILNLQEYIARNGDAGATAIAIKKVLNTKYYWFKAIKTTIYDSTGTAIYSKYPIIAQDTIPVVNGIQTEGMYVDIKKDNRIVRVYNVHLQSTQFGPEDNTYLNNLSQKIDPDIAASKHITGKLKRAFISRGEQVVALKQHLNQCPYPYILTGDFNDTPLSYVAAYMAKGIKNAFREKGYGLGVTFYGEYPGFQIDYIMVSPQFDVTNYKIIRERISDHYPVMSDVLLR